MIVVIQIPYIVEVSIIALYLILLSVVITIGLMLLAKTAYESLSYGDYLGARFLIVSLIIMVSTIIVTINHVLHKHFFGGWYVRYP